MSNGVARFNIGGLKGEAASIPGQTGAGLLAGVPVANFMAETHQVRENGDSFSK
jgi:hypothetical protein